MHFAHLRPAHLSLFELVGITDLVSLSSSTSGLHSNPAGLGIAFIDDIGGTYSLPS